MQSMNEAGGKVVVESSTQIPVRDVFKRDGEWKKLDGPVDDVSSEKVGSIAGDHETLLETVKDLNSVVKLLNKDLEFGVDQDTDSVVVKVMDGETGNVIRQIPPDELLRIRARIAEFVGIILDDIV